MYIPKVIFNCPAAAAAASAAAAAAAMSASSHTFVTARFLETVITIHKNRKHPSILQATMADFTMRTRLVRMFFVIPTAFIPILISHVTICSGIQVIYLYGDAQHPKHTIFQGWIIRKKT